MSKKKHEIWQSCEICDKLVYAKHVDDHKAVCEEKEMGNLEKYCYIEDGVLFGRVQSNTEGKMIAGRVFLWKNIFITCLTRDFIFFQCDVLYRQ